MQFLQNHYSQQQIEDLYKCEKNKINYEIVKTLPLPRHLDFKPNKIINYIMLKPSRVQYITDWFVEPVRVKCKNINHQSPQEFYENNKELFDGVTNYEHFKKLMKTHECALFPIDVAKYLYRRYGAKKILDLCAGWGDRLIAANMCGAKYTGIDPNTDLVQNYKEMSELFGGEIITGVAENAQNLYKRQANFIICCPPYFITEHYSKDEDQVCNRITNVDDWLKLFMFPAIDAAIELLEKNGHFALILSDTRIGDKIYNYTKSVVDYLSKKLNYVGCHLYGAINYSQPIFVFKN